MKQILVISFVASTIGVGNMAMAHHSVAAYRNDSVSTLTGSVVKVDWSFPHVYIEFKGRMRASEEPARWLVEADNPAMLRRVGLNRDTLQGGDVATLTVRPPVDSRRKIAFLVAVDRGDETVLDMRNGVEILTTPQNLRSEAVAKSLAGVWAPILVRRQSATTSSSIQLTDKGQQAAENADSIPLPRSECAPTPIPMLMFNPAFVSIRIGSDTVEIASEAQGMLRTVRLNERNHISEEYSLFGDSIGWWEGDVLVVDTVNFAPHPYGHAIGVPSSNKKRLIERFELNTDGKGLTYTVESEDSEYLAATIQRKAQWEYRPDVEFDQPACKAD